MIRKMLDIVLRVVSRVVWFERHAIVAHSICAMLAKSSITATRDLSFLRAPIDIYGVLFHRLPWPIRNGSGGVWLIE